MFKKKEIYDQGIVRHIRKKMLRMVKDPLVDSLLHTVDENILEESRTVFEMREEIKGLKSRIRQMEKNLESFKKDLSQESEKQLSAARKTDAFSREDIINRILALSREGNQADVITGILETEGVPTLTGKGSWRSSTVTRILRQNGR